MPVDKKWFADAFADRRISQNAFAKKIGMDPSSLSLLMKGEREFTLDKAVRIARGLGVSLDDVLPHTGIDITTRFSRQAPVLGYIGGDTTIDMLETPSENVVSPEEMEPGSGAFIMRTIHSALEMMDGWIVFVGPQASLPDPLDRTYIVKTSGEDAPTMRVIRRGTSSKKFTLTGIQQPVIYDAQIEWVRPVNLIRPL